MKFRYTSEVRNHRSNEEYGCLLVDFTDDPTVYVRFENGKVHVDWMPKNEDAKALVMELAETPGNPEFAQWLVDYAVSLSVRLPRTSKDTLTHHVNEPLTEKSNLAELIE